MGTLDPQQISGFGSMPSIGALTDELQKAVDQAEREGNEKPLVLQQLRYKIQLQRLSEGKDELTVEFEEPKKYELTEEEKQKQQKRKMRNREAAKKSRIRKKNQHNKLQKENRTLTTKNDELKSQVEKLRKVFYEMQTAVKKSRICRASYPRRVLALPNLIHRPLLKASRNSYNISPSQQTTAPQGFVTMKKHSIANVSDDEDVSVFSSYSVSTPESSHSRDSPTQPPLVICTEALSGFPPVQANAYLSSTSTSPSPPAVDGQGFASLQFQDDGESYMDFLEEGLPLMVSLPGTLEKTSSLFPQYRKQGFALVNPFPSGHSSADALVSPGSPPSSDPIFGAAQPGLHRGP